MDKIGEKIQGIYVLILGVMTFLGLSGLFLYAENTGNILSGVNRLEVSNRIHGRIHG